MIRKYEYFYYKMYKLFQVDKTDWMSEWKASLVVNVLIFFVLLSIVMYYNVLINRYFSIDKVNIKLYVAIFCITTIFIPNYFVFHYKDRWQDIVQKYDKETATDSKKGDWIAYSILLLIVLNFIFAVYLVSTVDWEKYQ